MTADDWALLRLQRAALQAFWAMRQKGRISTVDACGASWIADYGPLPCALPHGHDGPHRCYGSQGPIDFSGPMVLQRADG